MKSEYKRQVLSQKALEVLSAFKRLAPHGTELEALAIDEITDVVTARFGGKLVGKEIEKKPNP
ncbi:hypothetical protein HY008_02040 [Candidatus Woesebacteria bacterium]|nr:hypothetical protein [Candidatus Woesebacteria bacterium]